MLHCVVSWAVPDVSRCSAFTLAAKQRSRAQPTTNKTMVRVPCSIRPLLGCVPDTLLLQGRVSPLGRKPWRGHTTEFCCKWQYVPFRGGSHWQSISAIGRVWVVSRFKYTLGILPTTKENHAKPLSDLPKSAGYSSFCRPFLQAVWTDLLRFRRICSALGWRKCLRICRTSSVHRTS